jgi:putative transposase
MKNRPGYPTDLTDGQWARLVPLLPMKRTPPDKMREYVDAILYVLRTGGSWRMLPHDFPSWSTVYDVFQKLNRCGAWERINDLLRNQVRQQAGRAAEPSLLIGDSQSVKTTEKGAHAALTVANTSKDVSDT